MQDVFGENLLTFAAFAGAWGLLSPLLINLVKNLGGEWPDMLKKGTAAGFAVLGAVVTVGVSAGWGDIDIGSADFWKLLIAGSATIFPIANTMYHGFWTGTRVSNALSNVGT